MADAEWCWMLPDAECADGPYASKRFAIEAASREVSEPGVAIRVGRCVRFLPEKWISAVGDLSDIIERMEDFAGDNGWFVEDIFIDAKPGAEEALEAALAQWAHSYLTSTRWQMDYGATEAKTVALVPCPACLGRHIVGEDLPDAAGGGPCHCCGGHGTAAKICEHCGAPAACYGVYEGIGPVGFACNACCGHGNEDGWCEQLAEDA